VVKKKGRYHFPPGSVVSPENDTAHRVIRGRTLKVSQLYARASRILEHIKGIGKNALSALLGTRQLPSSEKAQDEERRWGKT
jgi:hypothetical protein